MINFTWELTPDSLITKNHGTLGFVVTLINWVRCGELNGKVFKTSGSIALGDADPSNFTEFGNISLTDAESWLESSMSEDEKNHYDNLITEAHSKSSKKSRGGMVTKAFRPALNW